jgi:hypothetical protein
MNTTTTTIRTSAIMLVAALGLSACSGKPEAKEPKPLDQGTNVVTTAEPANVVVAAPAPTTNGEPVITEKQAKSEPPQIATPEQSPAQISDDAAATGMTSRLPDPGEPAQQPAGEDKK